MNNIKITNYKPHQKGSLSAFFSVTLPSGLVVHECKLFEKEGRRWIGLPSRPFTGKDGNTGYAAILEFTERTVSEKFREAVLKSLDELTGAQTKAAAAPARSARSGPPRAEIPAATSGRYEADDSDIPF